MSKRNNVNNRSKFNTELIVSMVIIMVTVLGAVIPLHIQSSNQISAIQAEIRDFHGRLCAIEERNKR